MEIHELNTFSGTPGSGDYLATDNGNDTSKIPITDITGPLNARIDNIIAGGDAPSEAEIVDARLGADGVTYPSLGDAIRGQVSDLKSEIKKYEDYTFSDYGQDNLIAYTSFTNGKYVDPSSGNLYNNGSWSASDFIEVKSGAQYKCVVADNATWHYAFYDASKGYLSGDSINSDYYWNLSSNVKYVRISMPTTAISSNRVYLNSPKISQVLNDNIKVKAGNIIEAKVITVSTDGTKDFTSLRSALESINDSSPTNRYIIEFYGDGNTYELANDFSSSELAGSSDGLMIPEYTTLRGIGGPDKCRIQATVPPASANRYFSTINLKRSSSLENLRLAGINTRNVIHQDFGSETDAESHIENCELIGVNLYLKYVLAAGITSGCKYNYKNVIFNNQSSDYCYSCHNTEIAVMTNNPFLEFDNCRCVTQNTDWSFRLGSIPSMANGISCVCTLKGCAIPAELMLNEESPETFGAGIVWKVNGYANEINRVRIYATDGVDYSGNIDLI